MGGRGRKSPANKYALRARAGLLIMATVYEGQERSAGVAPESAPAAVAPTEHPIEGQQSEQVSTAHIENEADLPNITLINQETPLGGAIYPFLEQTGRAWAVVSHDLDNPTPYPRTGTFGMSTPTLRYAKDGKIEDVFVDGMTTEQFLAKTGLQLSMDKGGFVLSKRLSRIMRPYFATGAFESGTVNIRYMQQDETQKKVWDGAGMISRAMLERLAIPDGTPPAKRAELLREIASCKRVEFTVMTDRGQDKGHAIVSDDLDADFVLPMDTKKEVKLVNGQTWIGVNFVHAHDEMRIDIQSLINLHPFFSEEQYAQWLKDEGDLFAHAVESGKVDAAMQRIDPYATMEDKDKANVPLTTNHWLDTLYSKVKAHIEDFRHQRDELVNRTMPPARLFDHAFNDDERQHIQTGIAFNKLYSTPRGKILHGKRAGQRLDETDMQVIREQLDHFLSRFNESEHSAKTEHGTQPGMAQKTLRALREVGILDEIGTVDGGVVRYPGATISEPTYQRSIGIQGVWFNWYCQQQRAKGLPVPEKLGDVPKAEVKPAKARIAELAQSEFLNMPLVIRRASYADKKGAVIERLGAFTEHGELIGLLSPEQIEQKLGHFGN